MRKESLQTRFIKQTKDLQLPPVVYSNELKTNFKEMYRILLEHTRIIKGLFQDQQNDNLHMDIFTINNVDEIPKPQDGLKESSFFFREAVKYISEQSLYKIVVSCRFLNKQIVMNFVLFDNAQVDKYSKNIENVLTYILLTIAIGNAYASSDCAKSLNLFFYMTPLKKKMPNFELILEDTFDNESKFKSDIQLDAQHVNTAYTFACKERNEIVLYREEEWRKVFAHELIHCLGLDFSAHYFSIQDNMKARFQEIFQIGSDFLIYESYCEYWARFLRIFTSEFMKQKKLNFGRFRKRVLKALDVERKYSCVIASKIVKTYFGTLDNLFSRNDQTNKLIEYREKTNALCYYFFTAIMMYNFNVFFEWFHQNSNNLLDFNKKHYKIQDYADMLTDYSMNEDTQEYLKTIMDDSINIDVLNTNSLRMTIYN